jgi:hypothetical protein
MPSGKSLDVIVLAGGDVLAEFRNPDGPPRTVPFD